MSEESMTNEELEFCNSIAIALAKGAKKKEIIKSLIDENNWEREEAEMFVNAMHSDIYETKEGLEFVMDEGIKKIIFGFLWFIGGIFATWLTISEFAIGFVFIGAIFFGFIDMIIGLGKYLYAKYKMMQKGYLIKIPTDEYIESGATTKAKDVQMRIYDNDYLEEQLVKVSKILPTIIGKEIYMEYVTNADRFEESLDKIVRIVKLDSRIVLNVTEPVKFYEKDGMVYSDRNGEPLKIIFHTKSKKKSTGDEADEFV